MAKLFRIESTNDDPPLMVTGAEFEHLMRERVITIMSTEDRGGLIASLAEYHADQKKDVKVRDGDAPGIPGHGGGL